MPRMSRPNPLLRTAALCVLPLLLAACATRPAANAKPEYDPALAKSLGANANGMRSYIFVLLRTGPKRMPDGPARTAMFEGHMANIQRLAKEGKLVLAGPFDGKEGWRGMFIFAVATVEEAKACVETDPVIQNGEMVAEYHTWFGSAAVMQVNSIHERLIAPQPAK